MQVTYRSAYQAPEFHISHVDLNVDIYEPYTLVQARLRLLPVVAKTCTLSLNGQAELKALYVDGQPVPPDLFYTENDQLHINYPWKEEHLLEIHTHIYPERNTDLMGFYASQGHVLTQCEPEGFRRITYFLDRPDVMAIYTTILSADQKKYPVLLSNGNQVATGVTHEGRHWARWEDPFPKPSYLFAMVAAKLDVIRDQFITCSGRKVKLEVWTETADQYKAHWAVASLKRAMQWDEQRFGLEYDLERYMIVATSDFNMGAMENKGLNIFNTKYVLAHPNTETDMDFEAVEAVIGHEYFHNWTGNRVTCRDWFQLSLKEGLTVFRDQEFTADQTSHAVKRIQDVRALRQHQFTEDSGPMAHPIRPDSYIEMNNFYTMTVYEKGAEVVRMYQTLLGQEGFLKGLHLYFQRHDGQAVTCDDFRQAMADANKTDLEQFALWYSQAGTPVVHVHIDYEKQCQRYHIKVKQSCPPTPGQDDKKPMHIPLAIGVLNHDGTPLKFSGPQHPSAFTQILELRQEQEQFYFDALPPDVHFSLLRNFSAPIRLVYEQSADALCFLMAHDADPFARWEAGQRLMKQQLMSSVQIPGRAIKISESWLNACGHILDNTEMDPAFQVMMLTLPSAQELCDELHTDLHPDHVVLLRQDMQRAMAQALEERWETIYHQHHTYPYDYRDAGSRSLKLFALTMGCLNQQAWSIEEAQNLLQHCDNMTDRLGALVALRDGAHWQDFYQYLQKFSQDFSQDSLAMDKYFQLIAGRIAADNLKDIRQAQYHPAFMPNNPNKVRALIGGFGQNLLAFHRKDGASYRFMADEVIRLQGSNPSLASRLASTFNSWRKIESTRQKLMKEELERIAAVPQLAKDVYEIVQKALN
jgi:aminopeptidase N